MPQYIISCCSIVDLTPERLRERDIIFAPFHYFLNGKEFIDDMGQSVSHKDFYTAMAEGAEVSTSQVNVEEYTQYFRPLLEQGHDILHLTLSSGLSGSYNSARIAAELLHEEFPERKLYIVDTLGASAGAGLLVDAVADRRDAGDDIDTLYQWVEEQKLNLQHWFTASDLTWFVKGGRISKAAGWFGTALKICPVLNVDYQGRLVPRFKIRGKHNSLKELVHQMEEHAVDGKNYTGKCFISHSDCVEDAQFVATEIEKRFPHLNSSVQISSIGTTIGSHCGPGTVALFFWGDQRIN